MPSTFGDIPLTVKQTRPIKDRIKGEIAVEEGQLGRLVSIHSNGWVKIRINDGEVGYTAQYSLDIGSGFPYVCNTDWAPDAQYNKDKWVSITTPNRPGPVKAGWVSAKVITPGHTKKYGDWTFKDRSALPTIHVDASSRGGTRGKTWLTVKALLDAFGQNRDRMALVNESLIPLMIDDAARVRATDTVIDGYRKAGTLRVLDSGRIRLEDIIRDCADAGENGDNGAGIYIRFYSKLKTIPGCRLYTGSTKQFAIRAAAHKDLHTGGGKSLHSRVYRDAKEMFVRVFCRIGPDDSAMLLLAEQITILLLGTCDLRVLRHSGPDYKPQTTSEKSDDLSQDYARQVAYDLPSLDNDVHDDDVDVAVQGLAGDEEDAGEADDADGKTGASKARWRAMKEVAAQIQAIAKLVFAKVDWVPAIDQPTFAGFYKNIEGLNVHSPFSETYSRAVVTKIMVPRVMAIYRRSALLCRVTATSKYVGGIGGKSPNRVEFYVHKTVGPPHGAKVSMVFEVTNDGKPHPHSWTSHSPARFNDAIPGGIRALGEAIGMLNLLERKIVTQGRRAFERYLGRVRILELRPNHLTQELEAVEDNSVYAPSKTGVARPMREVIRQYQLVGATSIGGDFKTMIIPSSQRRTTKCDRCYLRVRVSGNNSLDGYGAEQTKPCVETDRDQCTMCGLYDLPCTWTLTATLETNLLLRQAIWYPTKLADTLLEIEDPVLQHGLTMQPSSDAQVPSAIDWSQPGPAPKPDPPGSGLVLPTAGGPSAAASAAAPTSTLPVRPGGAAPAQPESTTEDFDFDVYSGLLREKTERSLRRATSMIAGHVNSNPRLNLTSGAEARAYLTELRRVLQPFVDAQSANHRLFLDILNNVDAKAGRTFVLSAFRDASGQSVQNRVPAVSELKTYVREQGLVPYELMKVRMLHNYIRSLGIALDSDVREQLEYLSSLYA
ncbi:hypothetical protein LTR86_008303 [Recurvomyces mirabilis]|nr:hypothetical protein LTR86_008303 [Recurvomyces mirabilis]